LPELEPFLHAACPPVSAQVAFRDADLPGYLVKLGLFDPGEPLAVEPAGEGNINWVRRVRSSARPRSFVVKQARPALERFPEYRVSTERIVFEARWYATVAPFDAGGVCPRVHRFDAEQKLLVLEDLAPAEPLAELLARGADASEPAACLGALLGAVHAGTRDAALASRFANGEMQRLHGDHIFVLPFRENDFPLTPALHSRARALTAERELVGRIDAAYVRYLEPRGALLHGDVQPTNVLVADGAPKLLDAEIAHVGDPAFDVGQLAGHLWLRALARGDAGAARPAVGALWQAYRRAAGDAPGFAFEDAMLYAGIELLRRTLGAARIPEVARDEVGLRVVEVARACVLSPPASPGVL
jgi:5-methylthioribose kinase